MVGVIDDAVANILLLILKPSNYVTVDGIVTPLF